MSFSLSMSEEYDRSYFVKSVDLTILQRLAVMAMVPLYVPYILWNSLTLRHDYNVVTVDKKKRLTGTFNCASSNELHMPDIKKLSRRIGVTINDIVTCSISTAMNDFFRSKGDESKEIQMVVPANVRFEFYPAKEKVILENKFSAIPLKIPLCDNMKGSYGVIGKATRFLRSSAPLIYAQYALTYMF